MKRPLALACTLVALGCPLPPIEPAPAPPTPATTTPDARETADVQEPANVAAAPPALEPLTPGEWASRVQTYEKLALATTGADADAHFALGRDVWALGLEDEAWEQWLAALALNADHAEARAAMGFFATDGGWSRHANSTVPDAGWIAGVRAGGRAFSFVVAVQDDASSAQLEGLAWRLRRMSWFLWGASEGQIFLDEIRIEDRRADGRFVIESGKLETTLLDGGGAFCMNVGRPDWKVVSAGKAYTRILAHEMLHGIFGLPDERHGCQCIMQGGLYGIRTDQLGLCDATTHRPATATPTSCWELALDRDGGLTHPNVAFPGRVGAAPEPRFTVRDCDTEGRCDERVLPGVSTSARAWGP